MAAKAFVHQLRKIPSYALPGDATCPICVQPYENQTTDSGTFEKAVCLPCNDNHIFGSECLLEWLTFASTCPLCRRATVFPSGAARGTEEVDSVKVALIFNMQHNQDWEEYWYITFWFLHLQGDRFIERKWQQWQQDWIAAAEHWDEGSHAQARAALSISQLGPRKVHEDEGQVKLTVAAIRTLRFREYRLHMQLRIDGAERPELKAPPGFQLTPAQENMLFLELDRREAFAFTPGFTAINKRALWNKIRDVGFVWDPDWVVRWSLKPGRWSRYSF